MKKKRRLSPSRAITQPTAFETLDISPLIDVSFLLLIYFLTTATLRKAECDLATRLPGDPNTQFAQVEILSLDIEAHHDGSISLDGRMLDTDPSIRSLPNLVRELEVAKDLASAADQSLMANIKADDDLAHQRFTDVLNALAYVGIKNVALDGAL